MAAKKKSTRKKRSASTGRIITQYDIECAARLKAIYLDRKKSDKITYVTLAEQCGWTTAAVGFYMNADIALNYKAIRTLSRHLKCKMTDISPRLANDDRESSQEVAEMCEMIGSLSGSDRDLAYRFLEKLLG